MENASPLGPDVIPIGASQVASGSFSTQAEEKIYTFSATANEVVDIAVANNNYNGWQQVTELLAPDGTSLGTIDQGVQDQFTLAASGTYVIRIHDDNYTDTGNYAVGLEEVTPLGPGSVPIALGTVVSSSIKTQAREDVLTFTGSINQIVGLTAADNDYNGWQQVTELYAPDSTLLGTVAQGAQKLFTLTEAGTYTIRIHDDNFTDTGNYSVGLTGYTPLNPNYLSLAAGGALERQISTQAEDDALTFFGNQGDDVQVAVANNNYNGYQQVTEVYSPAGVQLGTVAQGAASEFTLPATGIYVIRVHDDNFTDTGNYGVSINWISPLDGCISGQVFNDVNSNGIEDSTETGLQGCTVYLDANNDGILDDGERSTTTDILGDYAFTALPAGNYTVREIPQSGFAETAPSSGAYPVTLSLAQNVAGDNFGNHGNAAPRKLVFAQQPVSTTISPSLAPITVDVEDSNGNILTGDTSDVTLAINGSSVLGGTTTVAAVNGVATFSDLSISTAGDYSLTATDGSDTAATSANFTISLPTTTKLVFAQQPTDITTASSLGSVTVDVENTSGSIVTTDSSQVTIAIAGTSGAALGGIATVAAVNGVATFTGLSITTADNYALIATDGSDTPATSTTFAVSPPPTFIGNLDPAFGVKGVESSDIGFSNSDAVAQDGSDSILVGTIGTAPDESFGVARDNADGSADDSFGGGVVSTSFGGTDDVPAAAVVLGGGQVLVAGTATIYTDGAASGSEFAVAEYNTDGSLDTGFGGGTGEVLIRFSDGSVFSNDVLNAMAVGTDGAIYLGGSSDAGGSTGTDFAIAELNADGSVHTAFGSGGTLLQDFDGGDDVINSLALQGNGDIVAAGSATIGAAPQIALARFLPSGALDVRFGTRGLVTTSVGDVDDSAASVVIQPKGQIVVGGSTATDTDGLFGSNFVVVRYTSAGRIDRSFGKGPVITSFSGPSAITQLILQADGDIIASGKTTSDLTDAVSNNLNIAVVRYTARGALDTVFDGTGKTIINLGTGTVTTSGIRGGELADAMIEPLDTEPENLHTLINSKQGAATIADSLPVNGASQATGIQGGDILVVGNHGDITDVSGIVAMGVDLAAKILSALPASALGGLKATVSISIAETGPTEAIGTVTIELQFATDTQGDGATPAVTTPPERINLRRAGAATTKSPSTIPPRHLPATIICWQPCRRGARSETWARPTTPPSAPVR